MAGAPWPENEDGLADVALAEPTGRDWTDWEGVNWCRGALPSPQERPDVLWDDFEQAYRFGAGAAFNGVDCDGS